jgi:diguanylate cyclase (GGDEF)-like protein
MKRLNAIDTWNGPLTIAVSFALITAIGFLDYITGYELSLFLFYFIPVFLLTWKAGRWFGLLGSLLSAVAWAVANSAAGQIYPNTFTLVWNTAARLLTFSILTIILSYLKGSISHLEGVSRTDPLTGAANSREFVEALKAEIERARRYARPFTIVYFDLDNFKGINDTYGHVAGDSILKTVVTVIRPHIRLTDVLARLGGDEFALLLPETEKEAAHMVISKIRAGILHETVQRYRRITVSVGSFTVRDASLNAEEVIKKVDDLMYEAKLGGKDQAVFSA